MTAGSPTGRGRGPAGATTRPAAGARPGCCLRRHLGGGVHGGRLLVSHWRRLDLGGLGNVRALDSLGALGDLGALDDLGALGDVRASSTSATSEASSTSCTSEASTPCAAPFPPASSPVGPDDLTAAACAAAAI